MLICFDSSDVNIHWITLTIVSLRYYHICLGLTASPGTNRARDVSSAVDHLRKLMANLDVSQLSVVIKHKEQLLEYCKDMVYIICLRDVHVNLVRK
jgi:hypothetical protein